uniref:Uncharacterized protein n=1 Tax=Heterorhabditis bacteriophora TaxID=37862 RepID=A0A1I7WK59_HETBA
MTDRYCKIIIKICEEQITLNSG